MLIRSMQKNDIEQVLELWQESAGEGLYLYPDDDLDGIARFLDRNEGMSFVADDNGRVAGVLLGGYDGKCGYLYHLAVDRDYRGQNLGRRLMEATLGKMQAMGLHSCHFCVLRENKRSVAMWESMGLWRRDEGLSLIH
ncbi:MAG: GNAT family N-acetyltransferase, partial [Negativicutes bacterium]|nr:GNAT family N-acetyltransferase [Negativicutes bacterium]